MSGLRTITFDEVAKHNTKEDCWVIVEDKVWDLTGFAVDHPGGAHLVQEQAGKDGTTPFVDAHSTDIIQLTLGGAAGVKKALMGVIDRSTVPASAVSGKADHGAPAEADDDADEWEVPPVEAILNVHDLVAIAERKLVKEGKKQAWDYYSSGACDELTYQENELAFKRIWMRPRVLVDVKTVDLTSKILGATVGAPLFLSACAMCGMGHEDGELAWAESAAGLDIPFMSPNLSSKSRSAIFAAQQASPTGHRMFQIYVNPDRDVVLEQLRACEAAGVTAVCVTVDSAVAGPRERDQRNKIAMLLKQQAQQESAAKGAKARKPGVYANRDPALNWKDVAWFCSNTTIPIVLKGVQCGEDAVLAAKAGVAAILVSNHGGRNMDTARSSIEALPEIISMLTEAGLRSKLEVWLDGGIRRGSDVVKALALGANACGIGKPAMYGMSCYGAAGITKCVEILKREMVQTMQLCGAPRFDLLSPSLVDTSSLSDHSAPPKQAPSPYAMPPPYVEKLAALAAKGSGPKDPEAMTKAELRAEVVAVARALWAKETADVYAAIEKGHVASAATLIALFLSAYVIYRVYPLLPMHFGVHIATMALGAFGLPTLALHLVRKRTAYKSMADRTLMVKLHAATQVANVGCFTFGARAIYLMKEEKGLAHLASTHSKIGLLTLMLSFASFCIAMRRTANLKKLTAPKWVWGDWLHKQLGVATYVVGAVAGANGLYVSKWGNGVLGFPLVYVLCALTACMVVMALAPVDYKKHAAAK